VPGARSRRRTSRGGRLAQGVSRRRPVQRVVRRPPRYAKRTFPECPSGVYTRQSEHGCATMVPRFANPNRSSRNGLHPEHMRSQGTDDNRSKLPLPAPRLWAGAARPPVPASRSRRAKASRRGEAPLPQPAGLAHKYRLVRANNQSFFPSAISSRRTIKLSGQERPRSGLFWSDSSAGFCDLLPKRAAPCIRFVLRLFIFLTGDLRICEAPASLG
jgi:hypothetical protein